ncbi:hypothetical protein ABT297_10970 [Dactylosporangium sp. NPDC000555]|uniref:hypothetical protein n=1 Tax=Dactylosporangium sp. NPDC000555 TaxID=3154260 RepID=UPI0033271726
MADFDPDPEIPEEAEFWMPSEEESGEGLAYFHDVWDMRGISRADAEAVVALEQSIIRALDLLATDAESFEELASVLEFCGTEFPPEDDPEQMAMFDLLAAQVSLGLGELNGLEIGVAGVSHALSAIGGIPAASCRSHAKDHSWSDAPVVYFATGKLRAEWLQPLVESSGCGFCVDSVRPNLLAIRARSVLDMNRLAAMILSPEVDGQLSLLE